MSNNEEIPIITSKEIKLALLKYYRFERSMVVGTEVNHADILAISNDLNSSYEVEVKVSLSDLKKDFSNKRAKHAHIDNSMNVFNPNYFYFCFPNYLLDKALSIIAESNEKYGIMIYKRYGTTKGNGHIDIIKRAKKVNHSGNDKLYEALVKRISSELINMYIKYEK